MSTTLGDIANNVANEYFNRSDVYPMALRAATKAYGLICSRVPFDELQDYTNERSLSTSENTHEIGDIVSLNGIISIRISYSATNVRRMRKASFRTFENYNPSQTGRPYLYARRGTTLVLNCVPNSAYTLRITFWKRPAIETDPADTVLVWPSQWDELLEWETIWRCHTALKEHDQAMMLVQPSPIPSQAAPRKQWMGEIGIIPRLWNDLCKTTSFNEAIDDDFGLNPIIRNYTAQRG